MVTYLTDKYNIASTSALQASTDTSVKDQTFAESSKGALLNQGSVDMQIVSVPEVKVKDDTTTHNPPVVKQLTKVTRLDTLVPVVKPPPVDVVDTMPAVTGGACLGSTDPFAGQSVELFSPPKNSVFSDVMKWEDAKREVLTGVKRMNVGSTKLRDFIHKEVRRLQLLRFEIFCKYV